MADIVWTINPENDQFEKIISGMRTFAYELLGAKKIDFEFIADDVVANMKLPMDIRKNSEKIQRNLGLLHFSIHSTSSPDEDALVLRF